MINPEYLQIGVTFVGIIFGSAFASHVSNLKFKHDLKREKILDEEKEKKIDVLAMVEVYKANADLREELRKEYAVVKNRLDEKSVEADNAWNRLRDCDKNRHELEQAIAGLRIKHADLECAFHEFKQICESKHQGIKP